MNPEEAKNFYLGDLKQKHFAKGTINQRRIILSHFLCFLESRGVTSIFDVKKDTIVDYLVTLTDGKKSPSYVQNIHVVLQSFFRILFNEEHLSSDLSGVIVIPKRTRHVSQKILTQAEVTQFLSLPDVKTPKGLRDRAMLEILYCSALRNEEVIHLDLYDIREKDGTVFIRQGKGRKDRVVPIGRVALKWIKKYLEEVRRYYAAPHERALFVGILTGVRMQNKSFSMLIHEYHRKSGIPKRITPHTFRHTCATHMLQGGADIRYVQEMLGHTSAHTTEIYTHLDIRDLKAMTERIQKRKAESPVNAATKRLYHHRKK